MWDAPWHWVVLAIVVIALFGYKRLPDAARSLGRSLRIFKTEVKGMSEDDKKRAEASVVSSYGCVRGIVWQQPGMSAAALERLYRRLAVEQRGDNLTVLSGWLLTHHDPVAVGDRGIDHGVAAHLEQEQRAVANQRLRQ